MRSCYALAVCALLAAPATAQQKPSNPQTLFKQTLLHDAGTSKDIKSMLRSGRGFVEFDDVTGDGKADALVRVMTGGAAGAVAAYALSTDGTKSSNLRVVMRNQRLYRATLRVNSARNLVVRVPVYAAGDTMCCPSRARDRTYAWDAKAKQMRRISMVEFPLM
ncbi:MAG: hypothetical protein E6G41_06965 [Actinobacteria bacterium]|nr:MAG: hypothetical protein E6G41_06965 [Actinomycetota bacterium]